MLNQEQKFLFTTESTRYLNLSLWLHSLLLHKKALQINVTQLGLDDDLPKSIDALENGGLLKSLKTN